MPKMIVGLFDTLDEAQNVKQNFIASGFAREDLRLIRHMSGASDIVDVAAVAGGSLLDVLVCAGVPEADARVYAEELYRGRALVMVRATMGMIRRAIEIMARHGVIDITTRRAHSLGHHLPTDSHLYYASKMAWPIEALEASKPA